MTEAQMHFTDDDLTQMFSSLLRKRTSSAKDLAKRVDCDPRAAEHYRAARHLPPLPTFVRIVRALGDDLAQAVLYPDAAALRLQREVEELERQLAETRAALRDVAGASSVLPQGVARHEDGAAELARSPYRP